MDINLSCPINQLGYGVVGLNVFLNLQKNHNVALWPIGPVDCEESKHDALRASIEKTKTFNYTAPSLKIWHQFDMASHVGNGKKFGLTFFETNKIKENEIHHLKFLEKVFVTSSWAKEVLINSGLESSKIVVVKLGVDKVIFPESKIDDKKTTKIVCVGKWEIRKGHDLIIDIIEKTFDKDDDFKLIMCCSNPFLSQEEQNHWISFFEKSKYFDKIIVLKERLKSQADVNRLMHGSDVGIFPYRAEAWNLELSEMLSMGKHCIATNYSGPKEFANDAGAILINSEGMESAYDGKWFDGSAEWAKLGKKYVEEFSSALRNIHEQKQKGDLKINSKGIEYFNQNTWEKSCETIVGEL
jgi:glycosyltransferase involved in cell wall biosynthesis